MTMRDFKDMAGEVVPMFLFFGSLIILAFAAVVVFAP